MSRSTIPLTLVAGLLALAACSGGQSDELAAGLAAAPKTVLSQRMTTTPPLLDDQGQPTPSMPSAVPKDSGAHTRGGHYATALQAQALEAALGERALRVNVECCGIEAADLAVMVAWGLQAAHDLDLHAPVLVRGADQRLAASVVNRMNEAGHTHVWLVTN